MNVHGRWWVLSAALGLSGCAFGVQGSAGGVLSTSLRDGHQGAAFQARAFAGVTYVGLGVALRGKAAETFGQGTVAGELYLALPAGEGLVPYLFVGVPLLSLESVEGDFVVGALGPYAELGLAIALSPDEAAPFFTVAATIEYAARFAEPHSPGEGYASLMVGIGWGAGGSLAPIRDAGRRLLRR